MRSLIFRAGPQRLGESAATSCRSFGATCVGVVVIALGWVMMTCSPASALLAITGTVFEDVNYGGGLGRSLSSSSGVGLAGITLEVYSSGSYVESTTTASGGTYSLPLTIAGTFTVRVVTPTKSSRTGGTVAGLCAVQTYRTDGSSGSAVAVTDHVGGETPNLVDAAANSTSATLASLTAGGATPESITTVSVTALGITGVDFGYNFDTIVNVNDTGQGSFRQFITNANALGGVTSLAQVGQTSGTQTSIFMISNGTAQAGLNAGYTNLLSSGVAVLTPVSTAYPTMTNAKTVIDGTTQTTNVPNTNAGTLGTGGTVGTGSIALATPTKPTVQIVGPGTAALGAFVGGLTIAASNSTIRGIAIYGFNVAASLYGDIVVTGGSTTGTLIEKNVIGTTATSFTSPALDSGAGIYAIGSGGGTIQNNVIGYIKSTILELSSTSGWTISGNEIRAAYGLNNVSGIYLPTCSNITLTGNLVTANPGSGVALSSASGTITITNNTISGNGISISGFAPSITPGISLQGAGNTVSSNIINGNYGAGILVASTSTQNTLSQNSIYSNGTITGANGNAASGEIGIDLQTSSDTAKVGSSPYITPNVSGGTGTGGDNLQAFPVLDGAYIIGANAYFTGYARPGATVELFVADTSPASGFGQGKTYLGSFVEGSGSDSDSTTGTYSGPGTHVGTDSTNRFRFSLAKGSLAIGSVITASATLAANGTSEFGPNITIGATVPLPSVSNVFAVSPTINVVPGSLLTYTGSLSNTGTAPAYTLAITEPIPTHTDFQIGSPAITSSGSSLTATYSYSNDSGSTWTYSPTSGGGGAISGYDRSVTNVKFVFSGSLGSNSPYNVAGFSLIVRVQ